MFLNGNAENFKDLILPKLIHKVKVISIKFYWIFTELDKLFLKFMEVKMDRIN